MYDSVFMSSFGSNIYETLGGLETNKEQLKNTVIWNSVGSASLIIFFKIPKTAIGSVGEINAPNNKQ